MAAAAADGLVGDWAETRNSCETNSGARGNPMRRVPRRENARQQKDLAPAACPRRFLF